MKKVLLTVFLLSPIFLIAGLMYSFARSVDKGSPMAEARALGAGAGDTGGANALGEWLSGRRANAAQPRMVQPETLEGGVILIVQDKSQMGSKDSPIYIAGTFNNWNPGDDKFKLEPQSDMRWRVRLPMSPDGAPYEFKFTRGSWDEVELAADLADVTNRRLPMIDAASVKPGEPPKIELVIEKFADQRPQAAPKARTLDPYRAIGATGDVRRLQVQGGAATAAGNVRDLIVWLPPGYDLPENATRRYPVLYMHDGQNLFETHPLAPGEWKADETAGALIASGKIEPIIIVGIPHSGAGRISEYLPESPLPNVVAEGDRHVEWLLREVKPRVERAFRVDTRAERTAIGGSSLGAVIALHAAARHPEAFGIVLAESLPLRTGDASAWERWLGSIQHWPKRIFLGMGGREGVGADRATPAGEDNPYVVAVKALDQRLAAAGVGLDRRKLMIVPDAEHTESAWAARFPEALAFLFPAE